MTVIPVVRLAGLPTAYRGRGQITTGTPVAPLTYDHFVSPTGNAGNPGTYASPWTLAHALSGAGGSLTAGETCGLKAGTYTGDFTCTTVGTSGARITFANADAENAKIDGRLTIDATAAYTDFRSGTHGWLEVMRTDHTNNENGIDNHGPNCRVLNVVVHDVPGTGIGAWTDSPGGDCYGNLIYNVGKVANQDHGFYVQNDNQATVKRFAANIIYSCLTYGYHAHISTGTSQRNMTFERNIVFIPGALSGATPFGILSGPDLRGHILRDNQCWHYTHTSTGWNFSNTGVDLVFTDNWVDGGADVVDFATWTTLSVRRNTVYSPVTDFHWVQHPNVTGKDIDENTYYMNAADAFFNVLTVGQKTFAQWQSDMGYDAGGTRINRPPTGAKIVIWPNEFEGKRAHIGIINYDDASTVAVNLSSFLNVGDSYAVYNVQNVFGSAVLSGTYNGGTVSFPMTGTAHPTPINTAFAKPADTGPRYHAFIVRNT